MIARWTHQIFSSLLHTAMGRLWVRLSLAFSAVAFISVASILIVITLGSFTSSDNTWPVLDELQRPSGTIERLSQYYNEQSTWRGVEVFLEGVQSTYRITPQYSVSFAFMDANDDLLFNSHPTRRDPDTVVRHNQSLPVVVDGEPVGTLNVMQIDIPGTLDWQESFLNWLGRWLWLIVLAGVTVGILAGVMMSRTLAAPMSRLSRAAQQIGARKLSSRVEAIGTAEVIQLAKAFNDMAHDLEEAESLRRNMVADVAHELRTPLTVLQGNLRAIIDGVYPMDTKEIASLYDQTLVLKRLVNDLHELSQAEAKTLPLNLQPLDVVNLINTIVSTFASVAEERGIHVKATVSEKMPFARADVTRISQVMNNLLDNAVRHTPDGGEIYIRTFSAEGRVYIKVSDTGKGITGEHLPYVFERFYRVDRARSRHTGGSGLGLAIAKAIIEAHNGTITVSSAGTGRGTTFTVELPAADMIIAPEPLLLSQPL